MAKNVFDCKVGGVGFSFFISDEDASQINTAEIKEYTPEAAALVDAAREVMGQKMFGSTDVRALAAEYPFYPFNYQIENVERMLNRFCGRGVFGDQVGLGKTIEALMTAHVMFKSGSIRNTLLIVEQKTIAGWVNEILTKFPDIFKLYVPRAAFSKSDKRQRQELATLCAMAGNSPDAVELVSPESGGCEDSFIALINKMAEDNGRGDGVFRVYIASDTMLSASNDYFENMRKKDAQTSILEAPLEVWQRKVTTGFIDALRGVDVRSGGSFSEFFERRLIEYEGALGRTVTTLDGAISECLVPSRYLNWLSFFLDGLRALRAELGGVRGRLLEGARIKDNLAVLDEKISMLESARLSLDAELAGVQSVRSLFSGERIIDLLMIDEIHKVYNTGKRKKRESFVEDKASYLSSMQKKFCVLISATPVRTRLEDIFELLYMADPGMFGRGTDEDIRRYFYTTLCRLPVASRGATEDEFPLAQMINDDRGNVSKDKIKVFLGLVNNFFTRKRINDVKNDMMGISGKAYASLSKDEQRIVKALTESIITKRAVAYMQRGSTDTELQRRRAATEELTGWMHAPVGRVDSVFADENKKRHFFSAIDAAIIEVIRVMDELELKRTQGLLDGTLRTANDLLKRTLARVYLMFTLSESRMPFKIDCDAQIKKLLCDKATCRRLKRLLYSMADWRRREKRGMAFLPTPDVNNNSHSGEYSAIVQNTFDSLVSAVRTSSKEAPGGRFISRESFDTNADDDFLYSLLFDGVLAYISRKEDKRVGSSDVRAEAIRGIEAASRDQAAFCDFPQHIREYVGSRRVGMHSDMTSNLSAGEEPNRFAFVEKTYQAGVNLQQYRSFIFFQMDESQRLLGPADIEQWIGRIHRTGQVKNCRILTVLADYLNYGESGGEGGKYSPEFLEWYYTHVLADPEGLDLYGNTTPDVAFIEPIVCDCVRLVLHKNKVSRGKSGKSIKAMSFAELAHECFEYDRARGGELMKSFIVGRIRELCRYEGFGKPSLA